MSWFLHSGMMLKNTDTYRMGMNSLTLSNTGIYIRILSEFEYETNCAINNSFELASSSPGSPPYTIHPLSKWKNTKKEINFWWVLSGIW